MDGYAGKLLNLNLSDGSGREFVIPEEITSKYLGGKGIGVWLLYEGLEPYIDPLGPKNVLILMAGPLTGLGIPSVNHLSICTKSPLTGTITSASVGGDFAVKLKSCGYDGVILRGKSPGPVLIDITQGKWKIREAGNLWGLDVSRTQELLKSNVAGTLCIGPAGENLVRYATIASDEHTAQRGGAGAVMGSKLVKAIRAGGDFETPIFDRERLKLPVESIKAHLREYDAEGEYPQYGTASNLALSNDRGALPTRNFSSGTFEHYAKITGDALRSQIRRKAHACPGCPVACANEIKLNTRAGTVRIKGPGYQPLVMLGSNLLVDDLDSIIRNNYLCYLLGMDPISVGGTLAFAMELCEKGRMHLPIHFGSALEISPLLPLIAKREGPGDELADGAASLAAVYGYNDLAMVVKGMEISGYDPRGCWGQGLGYATCPAGGSHVGSMMASPELQGKPASIPGAKSAGKVPLTIFAQDMFNALDCLTACFLASYCIITAPVGSSGLSASVSGFVAGSAPGLAASMVNFADYHRALSYVTGTRYNRRTFLRVGERVFNVERLFNLREGFTSRDDGLPLRFIGEPFRDGPSAGKVVPLTKKLMRYYRARGWNEIGVPTAQHLRRLGIDI